MSHELLYTSAERGLFSGSQGFCTVAATRNIPGPWVDKLEKLSAYRHLYPASDMTKPHPVAYSHLRVQLGNRTLSVLSRVAAFAVDYTGRSNKLAHHLVLEADDQSAAGPGWMISQEGCMFSTWGGDVGHLPARPLPAGDAGPKPCRAWEKLTGDAGWAGKLVEVFQQSPERPVYLVFEPGTDVLTLIAEAMALMPANERWRVGFTTYFTGLAAGVDCHWRCVPVGSAEAIAAGDKGNATVWELGRGMGRADGDAADAARAGRLIGGVTATVAGAAKPGRVVRGRQAAQVSMATQEPTEAAPPAVVRRREIAEGPPPSGGFGKILVGMLLGAVLTAASGFVAAKVFKVDLFGNVQTADPGASLDSELAVKDLKNRVVQANTESELLRGKLSAAEDLARNRQAAIDQAKIREKNATVEAAQLSEQKVAAERERDKALADLNKVLAPAKNDPLPPVSAQPKPPKVKFVTGLIPTKYSTEKGLGTGKIALAELGLAGVRLKGVRVTGLAPGATFGGYAASPEQDLNIPRQVVNWAWADDKIKMATLEIKNDSVEFRCLDATIASNKYLDDFLQALSWCTLELVSTDDKIVAFALRERLPVKSVFSRTEAGKPTEDKNKDEKWLNVTSAAEVVMDATRFIPKTPDEWKLKTIVASGELTLKFDKDKKKDIADDNATKSVTVPFKWSATARRWEVDGKEIPNVVAGSVKLFEKDSKLRLELTRIGEKIPLTVGDKKAPNPDSPVPPPGFVGASAVWNEFTFTARTEEKGPIVFGPINLLEVGAPK